MVGGVLGYPTSIFVANASGIIDLKVRLVMLTIATA